MNHKELFDILDKAGNDAPVRCVVRLGVDGPGEYRVDETLEINDVYAEDNTIVLVAAFSGKTRDCEALQAAMWRTGMPEDAGVFIEADETLLYGAKQIVGEPQVVYTRVTDAVIDHYVCFVIADDTHL